MDFIEMETIDFVNKGDKDFETKKKALNAENLKKLQENIGNALSINFTNLKEYIDNGNIWSLDEVKTNERWIDGRPIYKKVWLMGEESTNLNIDTPIDAPIDDLDRIVDFRGMVYFDDFSVPFNFYNWGNTQYSYLAFYRNNKIFYRLARAIDSAMFVVKYVKKSDLIEGD